MDSAIESLENLKIKNELRIELSGRDPFRIQKCHSSPDALGGRAVTPGSFALVGAEGRSHLCRWYPKTRGAGITYDDSVAAPTSRSRFPIEFCDSIPKALSEIRVAVVFEPFGRESLWRDREKSSRDAILKDIIRIFTLLHGCEISLRRLPPCERMGMKKITVRYGARDEKRVSLGYVTDETEIFTDEESTRCTTVEPLREPIFGLDTPLRRLIDIVKMNESHGKFSNGSPLRPPKQILVIGPSGCGKTSLIKLLTEKTGCPMFSIVGHDIIRSELGETEISLKNIFYRAFECAKINGKCIINLDDVTNLCPRRRDKSPQMRRIATRLLGLLEKCDDISGVIVIATTADPEKLDPSLRRYGRLETEILIEHPGEMERFKILEHIMKDLNFNISSRERSILCREISKMTPGYVGADLKSLYQRISARIDCCPLENCLQYWIDRFRHIISRMTSISLKGSTGVTDAGHATFDDLAGLDDIKRSLEIALIWPLTYPEIFDRMNISKPKGVLLHGPPGCAKTTLTRALARSGKFGFLSISAAELYSPYIGDAEQFIIKIFKKAKENSPCILFIDEIDAVAGSRGEGSDVQERILAALLTEMDGVGDKMICIDRKQKSNCNIIVVGATNRPDMIDPALLRPGRFDRHIRVSPPDFEARIAIFNLILKKIPTEENIDYLYLARKTEFYSGADIKNICMDAALIAMSESGPDVDCVKNRHFEKALSRSRCSLKNQLSV